MALHPKLNLLGLYRTIDLERYVKEELGYTQLSISRKRLAEYLNRNLHMVPIIATKESLDNLIHYSIKERCSHGPKKKDGPIMLLGKHRVRRKYPSVQLEDIDRSKVVWKTQQGQVCPKFTVRLNTGDCLYVKGCTDYGSLPGKDLKW